MSRYHEWLARETPAWIREGLITAEQAGAILARYRTEGGRRVPWSTLIFSVIGAALAGLGVILFFAYNWEDMPKALKLAVVFVSLLAAHAAGILNRERGNVGGSEGCHALGTMLFGAGIWLVAQIYHIDEHYPNAFVVWGAGALVLAWALDSVAQAMLAAVLLSAWNLSEIGGFHHPQHAAIPFLLAGILPLAWRRRSRPLTVIVIIALLVNLAFLCGHLDDDLVVTVLFLSFGTLIALDFLLAGSPWFPAWGSFMPFLGGVPYLILLFVLTFGDVARHALRLRLNDGLALTYALLVLAVAVAAWGAVLHRIRNHPPEPLHRANLAVVFSVSALLVLVSLDQVPGKIATIPFTLAFLTHGILMILQGCQRTSVRLTAFGCVLVILLALARYFDLFDSLLARSLVFLLVGAGLFATGHYFNRARERREGGAP